MTDSEIQDLRRTRLSELAIEVGGNAALGRLLGHSSGAFVGQMLSGHKKITESTIRQIERLPRREGWFETKSKSGGRAREEVDLSTHPDLVPIRRVNLKLHAGMVGFAVDSEEGDSDPIFFRSKWLAARGYKPHDLIALSVRGSSMEPTLYEGDLVVVNTADRDPKDGGVSAINYEGESVIKRLQREGGSWYLASDNPDQRRFPRKEWIDGEAIIIGAVIHRQSELL